MGNTNWHPVKQCDVPELDVDETWECSCGRMWACRYNEFLERQYYELVTETSESDEYTSEVLEVSESDNSVFWLRSQLLHQTIDSDTIDEDVGVQVHQDGRNIAVVAGTVTNDTEGEVELRSYVRIGPDGARDLADALYVAAENSEREYEDTTPDQEPATDDSILKKIFS
jgi:hypothetical protein